MSASPVKELKILRGERQPLYRERSWVSPSTSYRNDGLSNKAPSDIPPAMLLPSPSPADLLARRKRNAFLEARKRALDTQRTIESKRLLTIEEEAKISAVWEE